MRTFYLIYKASDKSITNAFDNLKDANTEISNRCYVCPNENFFLLKAIAVNCGEISIKGCDLVDEAKG